MTTLVLAAVTASIAGTGTTPPTIAGYTLIPALSDEFDGNTLDGTKWSADPLLRGWRGRQPGLFAESNVVVGNGTLQLWARAAKRNDSWPPGYDNYTTATVSSLASVFQGYFEIRWRSGSSGISSSWWFTRHNATTGVEIDVFETTGTAPSGPSPGDPDWCPTTPITKCRTGCPADPHGRCGPNMKPFPPNGPSCNMCPCNKLNLTCSSEANNRNLPSHVHIWDYPNTSVPDLPAKCGCVENKPGVRPCSKPATAVSNTSLAGEFHVASLNWTDTSVVIALDGAVVNTITSPCMILDLNMLFDRETMPGWMQIPDPATLPDAPFEVDYVRSYQVAH